MEHKCMMCKREGEYTDCEGRWLCLFHEIQRLTGELIGVDGKGKLETVPLLEANSMIPILSDIVKDLREIQKVIENGLEYDLSVA